MKRVMLATVLLVILVGCTQQQSARETPQTAFRQSNVPQLGDLCTGNEDCNDFCHFNSLECEQYCLAHKDNPTCQERFAFVYEKGYTLTSIPKDYGEHSVMNYGCEGEGPVTFTAAPMKFEDIETIRPLGLITAEGHITPTDHQYYYPYSFRDGLKESSLRDVYAPAAGVVTSVEIMPDAFNSAGDSGLGDYRLIIHHSCTFYTIYIHIRELSPKLEAVVEKRADQREPVKVAAGELIGRATAFDFSAHDEDVVLSGFIVPEHYAGEPWKIHTVDPFDYFEPALKTELLKKNLRAAVPLGGKIDYDIDGKLIGNWFVENTNGYAGIERPYYFVSHVSFAPNSLDPEHFIIGLGNYGGKGAEFGSDGPHPKYVDVESGIITYELRNFDYSVNGQPWDRLSLAQGLHAENVGPVQGILLVQLLDTRKLKLEAFPGKTSAEGFTSNAVIYER